MKSSIILEAVFPALNLNNFKAIVSFYFQIGIIKESVYSLVSSGTKLYMLSFTYV